MKITYTVTTTNETDPPQMPPPPPPTDPTRWIVLVGVALIVLAYLNVDKIKGYLNLPSPPSASGR